VTPPRDEPGLILSAYAAAPALDAWIPSDEADFLAAASRLPGVAGLEVPFYGDRLHKYDGGWFLNQARNLPPGLRFTITTIPDTMDRLADNPGFGLASTDAEGRQAALASAANAAEAVRRLNDAAGCAAVLAVHLFSAPRPSTSAGVVDGGRSTEALQESLAELAGYAWEGATPVLEHCDAARTSTARPAGVGPWAKGFLPIEAEIAAVLAADAGIGLALNWARSVIEQRDVRAPLRHLKLARDTGLLAGVVLSGCAPRATRFGGVWDDTHLPPASLEADSLLTTGRIREMADMLGQGAHAHHRPPPLRGLKVSAPPGSPVAERISILSGSIAAVRSAGF
jgi:Domain of unknown function (DUF4862)